jgi:DNA modification methylase
MARLGALRYRKARALQQQRGEATALRVELRHAADARELGWIADESIHLVVTSPPYWTLKEYNDVPGQLGHIKNYESFLGELDRVWQHVYRVLVPGGRLVYVVGDVCLSRRENGRHLVMPLHADISVRCRTLGFDNWSLS